LALPAALGLVLGLAACATPGARPGGDGPAAELAAMLSGTFDNAAQVAVLPEGVERQPAPGRAWLDSQWARHLPAAVPAVPGRPLYLEWRAGGPQARITRQRIWSLLDTPEGPRMAFYTLRDPAAVAGGDVAALARLGEADLTGFPRECWVRFARDGGGWLGRIDPAECRITAASGRVMALDVTIRVRPGAIDYQERGILPDGADAFHVPSHAPYRFVRRGAL
jgi:hypothetical protein